jgi:hypothetical protein
MWSGDARPFNGKHYQLAEPMNNPPPLSQPHPPILIGGEGENKTLRLVAQYADACNLFAFIGPAELARKFEVLKRHCAEVKRPYDEIERTALGLITWGPGGMTAADLISFCRELAEVGVQQYIFSVANAHEIKPLEVIGREVIPAVAGF